MTQPLVSIIIPTYNYASFLPEAIDSALAQTHKNIQVIVVDDGSTDNTKAVVEPYTKKIEYYYQQNGGVCAARAYGTTKARGQYIIYLDSDNRLNKDYVKKTLALLQRQPADVGFVYTQLQHFGSISKVTKYPKYNLSKLMKHNFIDACTLLKAEVAKAHRFDGKVYAWGDWDYYLTLADHHIKGVLLNEPLLQYRRHENNGSMLDNLSKAHQINNMQYMIRKHWRLYGLGMAIKHTVWYIGFRMYHIFDWRSLK